MRNFKLIETLLDAKNRLTKLLEEEHEEYLHKMKEIPYQKMVGSLMYMMVETLHLQ